MSADTANTKLEKIEVFLKETQDNLTPRVGVDEYFVEKSNFSAADYFKNINAILDADGDRPPIDSVAKLLRRNVPRVFDRLGRKRR